MKLEPPFIVTTPQLERAKEIYDAMFCLQESMTWDAETMRPWITKARDLLAEINEPKLSEYCNYVLLKDAEASACEWDNIRCIMHLIVEPESGGTLTVDELRAGKFEKNHGTGYC